MARETNCLSLNSFCKFHNFAYIWPLIKKKLLDAIIYKVICGSNMVDDRVLVS